MDFGGIDPLFEAFIHFLAYHQVINDFFVSFSDIVSDFLDQFL